MKTRQHSGHQQWVGSVYSGHQWKPVFSAIIDRWPLCTTLLNVVYIHERWWWWYTCYGTHVTWLLALLACLLDNPTSQTLKTLHPRPWRPYIPDLGDPTSQTLATLHPQTLATLLKPCVTLYNVSSMNNDHGIHVTWLHISFLLGNPTPYLKPCDQPKN